MAENPETRSRTMRMVKSRDTAPELGVRRMVHAMGYRFRLHRADLPGKPDLVFPRFHKVLLVHGCFWHGHDCARGARMPVNNREYWERKIANNRRRDKAALEALTSLGWTALPIWECELRESPKAVARRVRRFLGAR